MDETGVETFLFFRFFISSQQWPYFNFYHHSNIPNLWEWLEPTIKVLNTIIKMNTSTPLQLPPMENYVDLL